MLPELYLCNLKIYLVTFVQMQIIVMVRPVLISLQNIR